MDNFKFKRTSFFSSTTITITFADKVNSHNVRDFSSALRKFKETNSKKLTLNFSRVTRAYPDGMLPIIAAVTELRNSGISINVILPIDDDVRKLFRSVNWAYFLDSAKYEKSESFHDRHLVTRFFSDSIEQKMQSTTLWMSF